jgi:hypothetical protein
LLFADYLKIFRVIKSAKDCKLLQSDIDCVQKWCYENYMKFNTLETNIIFFTRKTNSIFFNYYVDNLLIVRTDCIKDHGVMLDSKLHFHRHIDNLYPQALKLLGLIRFITYNFSSLNCLEVFYTALVPSNLEYAPVAWNNLTLADSNKLENVQRKFVNLCCNRFIQSNYSRNYKLMLTYLHVKTLYSRRQHLDALFLVNVFKNKNNCYSIMDAVGLRIPAKQGLFHF